MKKLLNYSLITLVFLTQWVLPLSIFAQNLELEDVRKDNEKALEKILDIKAGKKVDVVETIDDSQRVNDRFVVFVKEKKFEEAKKSISNEGGVFSIEDDSIYGKVKAVPVDISYMNKSQKDDFLNDINGNNNVVAIAPVQKRELNTVPDFDDPLYPTDTSFSSSKQWYLSPRTGNNYGIDANNAWEYIDGLSKPYGGDSSILVAVIDTGGAYEDYSKYHQFSEMDSPDPWVFSDAPDFPANVYVNSGETANNQTDDDTNSDPGFCLDTNENGSCNAGELASFIDDRNGANIVDWGLYWSRVTYTELTNANVCANEPYASQGVKCVQDTSHLSRCSQSGLENWQYLGCYESDMGHPNDAHGHGTFVSNIIASKPDNGIGGVGIASGVTMLNIKIFAEFYSDFRDAWIYDSAYGDQIATAVNYAVDAGADIINMSFAGDTLDFYEKLAMDRAYYEEGVLLVASSGNSASSTAYYPAGYDSVMSVGASTKTGGRASYSNYGSTLDMVAPVDNGVIAQGMYDTVGNKSLVENCSWNSSLDCLSFDPMASPSIFSTFANVTAAGTSFATPQVVAVAALIKTTYPNLTASQIKYLLEMSSLPNGSASFSSSIGHGILNAYNAVRGIDYGGRSLDKIRRMYQTQLSTSGYLQTRFSDTYGARWSSWITSGNKQSSGQSKIMSVPSVDGRVTQIMKATNKGIYTRYASNFGFLGQDDSQWSGWTLHGLTNGSFSTVISGNNIILSWKGTDGKNYTRYTDDAITWSASGTSSKPNLGGIAMVYDSTNNRVLQLIRSTNNVVFARISLNNGASWGSWVKTPDTALGDPTLLFVDGRIIRAIRVGGDVIHTRYSTDGGLTWSPRNRTSGTSGLTTTSIQLYEIENTNRILQVYRSKDKKVYTRYSVDNGNTWTTQTVGKGLPSGVTATSFASTTVAVATIVQNVKGSNGYLYYRRSTNSGQTWSSWRNSGSITVSGNISTLYESEVDRVFVTARGSSGKLYTRISDDRGETYYPWVLGVSSQSGITTSSTETEELDLSN